MNHETGCIISLPSIAKAKEVTSALGLSAGKAVAK
jgi:hypothetical protein